MAAPLPNLDRYLAALWPDTYRCLGRRLLPLRIGHILLLRRIGSPFGQPGGRIPDAVDTAIAVEICSRPVAEGERLVRSGSIRLGIVSWWLSWRAHRSRLEAVTQLTAYLQAGMTGPRFWNRESGAMAPSTPFWIAVLVTLRRDLGMTAEAAIEAVAASALWECAAIWESTGAISFMSDAEFEAMAMAEQPAESVRN